MKHDLLRYLVDEGFVAIYYYYKPNGFIDGCISTLKEWEPTYLDAEDGSPKILWKYNEQSYTYTTNRQFFKVYGKLCEDANAALLAKANWIKETKETCMSL